MFSSQAWAYYSQMFMTQPNRLLLIGNLQLSSTFGKKQFLSLKPPNSSCFTAFTHAQSLETKNVEYLPFCLEHTGSIVCGSIVS